MNIELTILGSFVSLLLMVNAYFTRETLAKITKIELEMVRFTERHDATDERSRDNKKALEHLRQIINRHENEIHSLKGGQQQLASFIEEKGS